MTDTNRSLSREKFSINLKSLRLEKDISLNQAAKEIGITVSFLAALEKGKKNPHYETLDKICLFYGILPYQLFL